MAVNNLHQTEATDNIPDFLSGLTASDISINGISTSRITPVCDDYPFNHQMRYTGTIVYEEDPEYGRGRVLEFDFEARSDSGLLIIRSDVDVAIENIIGQINTATAPEFRIYRRISPHRDALWSFIQRANTVVEITLLDESGREVSLETLEQKENRQDIIGEYPIEDATFSYTFRGNNILVKYTAGSLQIDAEDPDSVEYIIQLFEREVIQHTLESTQTE